ncbi:MAG TPA: glycosyltransferase family 1 protein [Gemmataceae bacterium]|nr:glycosyltransferase family 1 protein [Gemmataceae bacterium]
MVSAAKRLHCELGPVLVNRTAVYKMCQDAPSQLARRGFQVECSALLARLTPDQVFPPTNDQQRWFNLSQRLLGWAAKRPGIWNRTRYATGRFLRWRHGNRVQLFLDPLYFLFYNGCRGAVIVYDITTVSDPHWHGPGVSYLYRKAFEILARSKCHIIASSQSTADQMRINWGIAPSRLSVVPLGLFSEKDEIIPAPQPAEPFLLFVGSLEPRKNVGGLIEAFDRLQLYAKQGIRLRIIGSLPSDDSPTVKHARSIPGVDLLGFVGEEDLIRSYEQCRGFVYPSFCEGFGLPLLEAMHHGCICMATSTGASPEVGGEAVLYVNPYSVNDIAKGLRRLVSLSEMDRTRISENARVRARQFTWSRFYDNVAAILEDQCRRAA